MAGPEVAFIDFRESPSRPGSAEDFVVYATEVDNRFRAAVSTANGIIKPWNWLIVDTPTGILNHLQEYVNLAVSNFQFNVLFIVDASKEFLNQDQRTLDLPQQLVDLHERVKFIFLSDHRGVMWASGTPLPSGVVYWEMDPDGSLTVELLADVLREQSVFTETFQSMRQNGPSVWGLGTKQIWMGKLSGELTQDAFVEVGKDILGTGQLSHREFKDWDRPALLIGQASVPEVIVPNGAIDSLFTDLKSEITSFRAAVGDTTRKQLLSRVANFPKRQQGIFKKIEDNYKVLDSRLRTFVASIDATNGFDREEFLQLKREGFDLRTVNQQDAGSQNLLNGFLQSILVQTRLAVEEGHSLEQISYSLRETSDLVEPRDNISIENEINEALNNSQSSQEHASAIDQSPPLGFVVRLGRKVARLLQNAIFRYTAFFLYLWTISAGVYEIVGSPDSHGFIPWPSAIREVFHLTAILICVILLVLLALLGLCLSLADSKIRRWGKNHKTDELQQKLDDARTCIAKIAVNDWACYETRSRVHAQLVALGHVFDNIAIEVENGFIGPFKDIDPGELDVDIPNPEVRQDLNARAQGRAFKFMSDIKAILRLDLADMIAESLEHTYALRTAAGLVRVPGKVKQELSQSIGRYVRDGKHFGLLFEHLSSSSNAKTQRRELAQKIWEEPGLVDDALRTVVLMPSPAELVTFMSANHLGLLTSNQDDSIEIRFLPSHANNRLNAVSNQVGFSPSVVTTDSLSAAGIIRVTPLRSDIVQLISVRQDGN